MNILFLPFKKSFVKQECVGTVTERSWVENDEPTSVFIDWVILWTCFML